MIECGSIKATFEFSSILSFISTFKVRQPRQQQVAIGHVLVLSTLDGIKSARLNLLVAFASHLEYPRGPSPF